MARKKDVAWGENGFEDWGGYMAAKKAKLEQQFHEVANKEFKDASSLFQGIAIFVNGYTDPTADELRRLMMQYGGTYHHYMRPRATTHIIASNLPYSKIVLYRKSQNPVPICKPQWITDSIKAGRILNFQNYLLYSNSTETQPQLQFAASKENVARTVLDEIQTVPNTSTYSSEKPSTSAKEDFPKASCTKSNNARCTKDAEFLSEFYSHSRLHHISTMGAMFKDYVNELRDKNKGKFPGLEKLKKLKEPSPSVHCNSDSEDEVLDFRESNIKVSKEPVVMHIDMDCFFVSVGIRNKPELKGLPVAVTHAKGNKPTDTFNDNEEHGSLSEVASCSYEARKAGVRNGMFLGRALKLCPDLKTIPYDFEGYKEVSYKLYDTVASYTLDIEAVSCDEMYADCTKILDKSGLTPMEFAAIIRKEIKEKTGCPVSTGFGNSKLLARLATKKAKPDGQFYLKAEAAESYIADFNVIDLPGVGGTTAYKLKGMNARTCAELQMIPLARLQKEFGKKTGEMLYNMCRGIDHSELNLEHVRKSVSAEVNYGIRFENNSDAVDFLKKLCEEVCTRLKKANAKGRSITLKLMVRAKEAPKQTAKFMGHGLCDYMTKSKNLITPVDDVTIITREVIILWNQAQLPPEDMRGIGIQISRLQILKNKLNENTLKNFVKENPQINQTNVETNVRDTIDGQKLKSKDVKNFVSKQTIPVQQNFDGYISRKAPAAQPILRFCTSTKSHEKHDEPKSNKSSSVFSDPTASTSNSTVTHSTNNKKNESILLVPSQDIDDSILNELPEDIKNEILNTKLKQQSTSKSDNTTMLNNTKVQRNDTESRKEAKEPNPNQSVPGPSTTNVTDQSEATTKATHDSDILLPSQEIDEVVLNQLPSEIKAEIMASMSKKQNQTKLKDNKIHKVKPVQTHQETFFKHVKPNSGKSVKAEMPPIQEIDMSVLIELPEDIRNEILNEYSVNKRRQETTTRTESNENTTGQQDEHIPNIQELRETNLEQNISFSQVDPDFLAALTEDMRNDVQLYCMVKKKEKESKLRQDRKEMPNSTGLLNIQNILRPEKKNEPAPKSKMTKNAKNNNRGRKKISKIIPKNTEGSNDIKVNKEDDRSKPVVSRINNAAISDKPSTDETEIAILHDINETTDKHQEILINLANQLSNLPLEKVKMQIQRWIRECTKVNEVDFCSLATFLSMMPGKKRIEELHVLLKTMHRCITETGNCVWHRTYRKIVKHVQQYMQIEYNSDLMVPPIRCSLLECNSDDVM